MIKLWKKYPYGLCLICLLFCAILLRVLLLVLGWPALDSDEAVIYLMASHIADKGEHPIFFYGQYYMGSFEAYFEAILFRLFGFSVLAMRLGMVSLFIGFLISLYTLTSRLYSKRFALFTVGFLSLGTAMMLLRQIKAIGGYEEIILLGALLFLLSFVLASSTSLRVWQRVSLYWLWGVLAGFALYSDLLIAPYVLMAGLLLLFRWRTLFTWAMWVVIFGLVIGALPMIYYNLTAAPGTDSWTTFVYLSTVGLPKHDIFWNHISNTFVVSLPIITGYFIRNPYPSPPHATLWVTLQVLWSMGYCALLACALLFPLWQIRRIRKEQQAPADMKRDAYVRQAARWLLALAALLTLIFYIKGSATIIDAEQSCRYLSVLWISFPVILWPLWNIPREIKLSSDRFKFPLRIVVLASLILVLTISTVHIFREVPTESADQQHVEQLANRLKSMHVTRIYSDYALCNRLIYLSHEQIICGNTASRDATLGHSLDRYSAYQDMLKKSSNPAFVYINGANQKATLEDLLAHEHITYQTVHSDEYTIYILSKPLQATEL